MARSTRRRTGRRTRSYNRRPARISQTEDTTGTRQYDPASAGAPRRSTRAAIRKSRGAASELAPRKKRAQKVLARRSKRRTDLQSHNLRHRPTRRLQTALLSTPRRDENARSPKIRCARNKTDRRAVLLATGYGGINHGKNYRKHKRCPA